MHFVQKDRTLDIASLRTHCELVTLFAILVDMVVRNSIHAAIRSIQEHTCIKFKKSEMALLYTSKSQKFAVVFSSLGNRYVLNNKY